MIVLSCHVCYCDTRMFCPPLLSAVLLRVIPCLGNNFCPGFVRNFLTERLAPQNCPGLTVCFMSIFPVLSAALYFGSWFFCKSIDSTPAVPDVDHPSTPQLQHRLSPPQTPVPGFVFRQERQATNQQADPEQEALAQAGPDSRSSSPVPGIARYSIDDDSVCLSFKTAGDESERGFLPQSESSI